MQKPTQTSGIHAMRYFT